MSDDFSKSCYKRVRVFVLFVLVARVFLEEDAGELCLYVNEEGFCQDIAQLSFSQGGRARE